MRACSDEAEFACALSAELYAKKQMVRLVHNDIFGWCVDAKGDLPGRSWWIYPSAVLLKARAQDVLGAEPTELIALLDQHFLYQVQQTLSRARRAGSFCIGGDRIKQWYGENRSVQDVFLLKAHDGGSVKLWKFLSNHGREADDVSLTQAELGMSFERAALGSAMIYKSGFCAVLRTECHKLTLVRQAE